MKKWMIFAHLFYRACSGIEYKGKDLPEEHGEKPQGPSTYDTGRPSGKIT
jgi:hypothetical protein